MKHSLIRDRIFLGVNSSKDKDNSNDNNHHHHNHNHNKTNNNNNKNDNDNDNNDNNCWFSVSSHLKEDQNKNQNRYVQEIKSRVWEKKEGKYADSRQDPGHANFS